MYGAVVALRNLRQHALAEKTYQQVVQARAAVTALLADVSRLATKAAERSKIALIRSDLASYDVYTHLLRQMAVAGNITRAIHVETVENLIPSNALPNDFAALEQQAGASVAEQNTAVSRQS